jgi:RNA polymerase sigma factor (sigma-70 family)
LYGSTANARRAIDSQHFIAGATAMPARSTMLDRELGALYCAGSLMGLTDSQLLERFNGRVRGADRSEADLAFAALIERHGPMVWRVCRSRVGDAHDAEDVFQATFLVLVKKARSLRVQQTLGPWLYAVAYRTGLNARTSAARRRAAERAAATAVKSRAESALAAGAESDTLTPLLHQEIMRLPGPFRAAIVLCDLQELSYREAARRLMLPLGTLQSRLARGRRRLRARLARQGAEGLCLPAEFDPALPPMGEMLARARPPLAVVRRTCRLAETCARDPLRFQAVASASIRSLLRHAPGTISIYKTIGIVSIIVTFALSVAVIFFRTLTVAQAQRGEPRPSPQSAPVARLGARAPSTVPIMRAQASAPRELMAASGRGTILLYVLDDQGDRLLDRPDRARNPWKEATRDVRWAVVTGVVDHRPIQAGYADVGRRLASPPLERIYRRVELQRQSQEATGAWSDWQWVAREPILQVLDNLPEVEPERTAEEFRFHALVDPLPQRTDGAWRGVDVERLVSTERPQGATSQQRGSQPGDLRGLLRMTPAPSLPPPRLLMLRAFDFSVRPGRTYRFRAGLVLLAPGGNGLSAASKGPSEVRGPWSEPTNAVTVP